MIFQFLYDFFNIFDFDDGPYAFFLIQIGFIALCLFALVFRLITRIKSFALFGG